MTDNKNRTVSEVRHLFTKYDGNLGANGSVSYLFSHQGVISFASGFDEERLMELALEAGAEDIRNNTDGSIDIITTVETFTHVKEFLENEQLSPSYAIVGMIPGTYVPVVNEDAENLMKMLEKLEELDDVQQVYTNADFPDDF